MKLCGRKQSLEVDKITKDKEKSKKELPPSVPFLKLFSFSTCLDKILILIGLIAAAGTGLSMPALIIAYGELTDDFVTYQSTKENNTNNPLSTEEFMHKMSIFGISCSSLGAIMLFLDYVFVSCLNYAAERQILRIRNLFFKSVLRQDIGWYDTHQTGDFASRVTEDLCKLQEGIGEKVGMFINLSTSFIANIIIAFIYGWKLTLVTLCTTPILVISTAVVAKVQTSLTEKELQAYAKSGSIAEEVLAAIRTVVAFGGQEKEVERYNINLQEARKAGTKRGLMSGLGGGVMWFITYASYSLAFWYGVTLIIEESSAYTPAVLAIVFFGVLTGAMNIGQASPYMEAFSTARGSAGTIFSIINRIPLIDNLSNVGEKLKNVTGSITFHDVHFDYPSRPDVKILQELDITINKGQTVALVGSSGCGKSTCIQLIQRFYDPLQGSVKLDGVDIRNLNLHWLRSQIGVVGQEPVLFGTTIAENIRYGKEDVTQEEIEFAAKEANAHDFIMKLPQHYDTMVGERGAQLSGGQKQRIAIARALVRKPAILLLDEATSALDTSSEAKVQNALNKASQGRTTIVVAHRLSTIRSADKIIVISKGKMVEEGTHDELMNLKGQYYDLVMAQVRAEDDVTNKEEENDEIEDTSDDRRALFQRMISITSIESEKDETRKSITERIQNQLINTKEDDQYNVPMMRIMAMNKKEWAYILTGCIGAAIVGFSMPTFAVLFGEIYGVLSLPDQNEIRSQTDLYSILFLITGIVTGIATFLQMYMFNVAGVKLTMRLRTMTFRTMLKQEIGWFDDEKNSTGALCARLSGDAASVQGATGTRLGSILQCISTLLLGIVLALFYEWKLGLVTLIFVPLVIVATFLEGRVVHAQGLNEKEALEDATKIAVEAISNIRTVVSLGRETTFHQKYMEKLQGPHNKAKKKTHLRGLVFGFGQSMPFFAYAAALYYGGYLVAHEDLHYKNVIKVSEALLFATMMVGQALAFAPNFNQAKVAAGKIFKMLDRKPLIYNPNVKAEKWNCEGTVSYSSVEFIYPNRPKAKVLNGLDLEVKKSQMVALVGPSGCGKSTCIQLLERFYDPVSGTVKLDDCDIATKDLSTLRSQMGIVSQEPVLFDRTIAENIAYGDNNRKVTMEEIIEAAKQANIHNFITSLPLGYETPLGEKGTQLSGGQKQRVAIARALVRNPRVLLLDEATSALDTESEKVVQDALDRAKEGRTCITIAHRLSTIQDADVICVIKHGKLGESGTHSELLSRKGIYYKLHSLQSGPAAKQ